MKFSICEKRPREKTGFKVAIIGAGPAGLGAAGVLVCMGHEVHVYDRLPEPGGMIIFAIPEFRIPKKRVRDGIAQLERLGVVFHQNIEVGKDITIKELLGRYDAVLIATGTWRGRKLNIPGENLPGVYNAMDWVYDYMLYKLGYKEEAPPPLEGEVGIIGAGLTAVDICEIAVYEYKAEPMILYRRSRKIAPGRFMMNKLEKMGVKIIEFVKPLEFVGNGRVQYIKLVKVKPTQTRAEPVVEIPGTEHTVKVDSVVVAAGLIATPPPTITELGVQLNRNGTIRVDENYMTNIEGLFAAGDVAHGPSNIGFALKSGKRVAQSIHNFLMGKL